jgi:hypothetical protein
MEILFEKIFWMLSGCSVGLIKASVAVFILREALKDFSSRKIESLIIILFAIAVSAIIAPEYSYETKKMLSSCTSWVDLGDKHYFLSKGGEVVSFEKEDRLRLDNYYVCIETEEIVVPCVKGHYDSYEYEDRLGFHESSEWFCEEEGEPYYKTDKKTFENIKSQAFDIVFEKYELISYIFLISFALGLNINLLSKKRKDANFNL